MSVSKGLRALRESESLDVRGVRESEGSQAVVVAESAHFSGSVTVDAGVKVSYCASGTDCPLLVDIVMVRVGVKNGVSRARPRDRDMEF